MHGLRTQSEALAYLTSEIFLRITSNDLETVFRVLVRFVAAIGISVAHLIVSDAFGVITMKLIAGTCYIGTSHFWILVFS